MSNFSVLPSGDTDLTGRPDFFRSDFFGQRLSSPCVQNGLFPSNFPATIVQSMFVVPPSSRLGSDFNLDRLKAG